MNSAVIQLIVLAGIALFLVLRLRNVLGTREGFEPTQEQHEEPIANGVDRDFEVIEGGLDRDIYDHVESESDSGHALEQMKSIEPEFSVSEFQAGARQAYEMILMAFEGDDLDTLKTFLSEEVYESFESVVLERQSSGLTIDATFVGVRELKISNAHFDEATQDAEISMRFVGELTSVVRSPDGTIVEGDPTSIKRQKDVWTFSRTMGSDDPNWVLVATGE